MYVALCYELGLDMIHTLFLTDSTILLGYITKESHRFCTFVENRASTIRANTNPHNWCHVSLHDNPAELLTKPNTRGRLVNHACWLSNQWVHISTIYNITEFTQLNIASA